MCYLIDHVFKHRPDVVANLRQVFESEQHSTPDARDINCAFAWRNTPQGHSYWKELYDLELFHHPDPVPPLDGFMVDRLGILRKLQEK